MFLSKLVKTNIPYFCSVGQKIPENSKELAVDYFDVLGRMIRTEKPQVLANMDETPLWFDLPANHTLDFKGVKTVQSRTTGNEKLR